jgi:hypothetical protein
LFGEPISYLLFLTDLRSERSHSATAAAITHMLFAQIIVDVCGLARFNVREVIEISDGLL